MNIKRRMKERILKERGLEPSYRRGLRVKETPSPDGTKTLAMRLIEVRFDTPIEELLQVGNLEETAKFLGVDFTTVSLWRLRLGLRGRKST